MQNEIEKLSYELESSKVQERQKAFNKFYDVMSCRPSDLQKFIDKSEDVSWDGFFKSTHKGILLHSQKLASTNTELNENDTKIKTYSRVILKLCDSPANEASGICYDRMMCCISEALRDDASFHYFGRCYLQILQFNVLKPKNNLTSITLNSWKDILEILFLLLKSKRHQIPFQDIILCTRLVLELGCSFSHLSTELKQYLPNLTSLLEKEKRTKQEKQELLIVAYHCCRNIAVDFRFEVCRFTEVIGKYIHEVFRVDFSEDTKESLFRLMDLSIVVHYPNLVTNQKELEYIDDKNIWNTQLRNYWHIVQEELKPALKTRYQSQAKQEFSQVFAQFAARLCYLIHWDDTVWMTQSECSEEGSSSKRVKRANKLQSLIDFAQPCAEQSEFNWKWMIVISEIVHNYPPALEDQDFQPLLQMLSFCQPTIGNAFHVYAFTKCCYVLLQRDIEFNSRANIIIVNLCRDLWHKIADAASRVCTSTNNFSIENHILLQVLIHYQKFPSSSFIEDVIKIFLTQSTIKCDATLQTLITILKKFNLDALPSEKELPQKILNYVFEKLSLTDFKKLMTTSGTEKPSSRVLSLIGVLCCLSKTDVVNYARHETLDGEKLFESNWKLQSQVAYKKEISEYIKYIQLKANERLLIEDKDFLKTQDDLLIDKKNTEYPIEIKCIVDPLMFDQLQKITEFKNKVIDEDKDIDEIRDYLQQVMESNENMMNIADSFLQFEALNEEKLEGTFIVKKIDFHLQEIERLFTLLIQKNKSLDMKETHQLLTLVKSLFSSNYHRKICIRVRQFNLENCIRWVSRQVNHKFRTRDDDSDEMRIGWNEFLGAKMEERLKLFAVESLLSYNNFEGVDTEALIKRVWNIKLDCNDNMDLHTVFHVLKLLRQQESVPQEITNWIWSSVIMDICQIYHKHQYVSKRMIESFEHIVHISKNDPSMTSNVVALFVSFGKLCVRPWYSPKATVKYIQQFKYFHKEYFPQVVDEEPVKEMYLYIIETFLASDVFSIKMASIKSIGYILKSDIEENQEAQMLKRARKSRSDIFKNILLNQNIQYSGADMETDGESQDVEVNKVSGYLQLFSTVYCVNFIMRKPILLELSKLILRYKLSEATALKMFKKILVFLKCDAQSLMDSNSLIHLLSQWINTGLNISLFPWYFSGCNSLNNFFEVHYDLVFLALMKNKCSQVERFANSVELTPKSAILELLPECFSFMLPIEAGCRVKKEIEDKAERMKKQLDCYFPADEQKSVLLRKASYVIGHVLSNVFDNDKFEEICGFKMEIYSSEEMIDCASFDKCLNHLKKHFSIPRDRLDQPILTFFCSQRLYYHFVEKLLMMQKKKVQATILKEHKLLYLVQYCVLVEKLFIYLNDSTVSESDNIKGFLVREITNFLCFLVQDEKFGLRLRETAATFLSTFLKKILPNCSADIKPFLSKILTSLVTICKNNSNSEMSAFQRKCFAIIQFLVFDQQAYLEDEIANLDRFPDDAVFKELQEKQLLTKYKNGNFSLAQEIEHFLSVKKRKIEGLVALRKHLAERKAELKSLFDELSTTLGFSEDGEKSLLHKLVRSLVGYARNINEDRAVEAVKCLGEIGNYNLFTMVFITEKNQNESVYERIESLTQCQKMICNAALDQMETMVLHENPRIFESASAACYLMLETPFSDTYKPSVYLRPFDTNTRIQRSLFYEQPKQGKHLDLVKIMKDDEYSTYKTWIKRLAGTMIIFAGNKSLEQVSSAQQTFAELMNPMMIQLLLCYNDVSINESIIVGINFFFDESSEKLNYPKVNEGSIFINKLAIRQMLSLVECIRIHSLEHPKSKMAQKIQELNNLNIAKAAKHCEAYFTAVLYCEMWSEKRLKTDSVSFESSMSHKTLQEIMYDAFTAIGIHDASHLFVSLSSKRSLYLQISNQKWQNVLEYDAAFTEDQTEAYIKLLSDIGLHTLTNKLAQKDQKMKAHQYECLWRLSKWDVLIEKDSETKDLKAVADYREQFEKYHYSALRCLKNGDELGMKIAVLKARKSILQQLKEESLECTKNLYKFLGMSHLIQQIDDFVDIRFNRKEDSHIQLLRKWNAQNRLPHDFKLFEPILSQRNTIFNTANIKAGRRTWIPEALQSNMLYIIKESIDAGCNNDAIKTIAKMRALPDITPPIMAELLIKEAQLNFKTDLTLAKHCLKRVLEEKDFEREFMFKSIAFRLFGEIQADNHADEIRKIRIEYFGPSVTHLEKYAKHHNNSHLVVDVEYSQGSQNFSQTFSEDDEDVVKQKIKENICVFDITAKYFDREYISLNEYIVSPDFKNKQETIKKNEIKNSRFREMFDKDKTNKDVYKSIVILSRSIEIDKNEVDAAEKQMKLAAKMAMYYYLRGAINDSGDNILSIFRIISIWMANPQTKVILKMLGESIEKIATYKFLVALPQLTVRLNEKENDNSNALLRKLIEKCAVHHPHHTLPLLLALVNSYADSPSDSNQDEPRVIGAKKLWKDLKKNSKLSSIAKQMEEMSSALIDLANMTPPSVSSHQSTKIPRVSRVLQLKNLNHIQCPTIEIPVKKDGNYLNSTISVVKWTPEFDSVGGINAPKKIYCLCSDGVTRSQLLKGKDDMRQDAVMQQVFSVVNQLLKKNKETNNRHACLRTYKVVPFSRRSGILEWCNNTMPIGLYLVGNSSKKGAHEKYNPTDWPPVECLKEIGKHDKLDEQKKEEVFIKICNNIQPAFQHFFYENFKNPGKWFERRLAYTTSVAVSSIVGYILGIGDRHVQNILIDCNTAEVIHIDFGIAFEQGKILPHKELIPFRLTRDIVAPMGVCGVDGIFRKTCEKTLELLRQNEKTLTTILEVLLYDPMYAWTLSRKQAQRHQFNEDFDESSYDEANQDQRDSMAARALLRVQAKLKGQADDTTGYTSVEGQVECLIQKAMSTSLLSRLFKGWQAYL